MFLLSVCNAVEATSRLCASQYNLVPLIITLTANVKSLGGNVVSKEKWVLDGSLRTIESFVVNRPIVKGAKRPRKVPKARPNWGSLMVRNNLVSPSPARLNRFTPCEGNHAHDPRRDGEDSINNRAFDQ